jgi:hypothetical protein
MSGRRQNCLDVPLAACSSLSSCSTRYCDNHETTRQLGYREIAEDRMKTQLQEYRINQKRRVKRTRPAYTARVNATRKQGVEHFYGSQGPASPVRRINPLTGQVTEIIDAKDRYDRPEEDN